MPTRDRRPFVARAIRCFLAQTYTNLELVILDDGEDAIADLVPGDPRIRYVRSPGPPALIGAKRNMLVDLARGDYIASWDDDDWHSPERVKRQMDALLREPGKELCGIRRVVFHEPETGRSWLYANPPTIVDGTIVFSRTFHERGAFPTTRIGSGVIFLRRAREMQIGLDDTSLYLGTVHRGNTNPKVPTSWWLPLPPASAYTWLGRMSS